MTIHNLFPRISSVLLSASIHVALGFALFVAIIPGGPKSGHFEEAEDRVLVVDMIPLNRLGAGHDAGGATAPSHEESKPLAGPAGAADITKQSPAPLTTATATTATGAGSGVPAATATMADLPSTDVAAYRARLQAHLSHYRLYPASAQEAGDQGIVSLHFIMDRAGHVSDTWIETSSGIASIDREAVEAVIRAQPLPPLPAGWPDQLDISLPMRFKLG